MPRPSKPRRLPATSTARIVAAVLDRAQGPVPIPSHIRVPARARPFWDAIIAARDRREWHAAELPLVAQCARTMAEVAALDARPARRSSDSARQRGMLIQRQCALLRALRIIGWRVPARPRVPVIDDDLLAR